MQRSLRRGRQVIDEAWEIIDDSFLIFLSPL